MITIKQAVMNVCNHLHPGQMILGYEMYDLVLAELSRGGRPGRPLQATISKRYRDVREQCGMWSVCGVSEYHKNDLVQLTDDEKRLGQRVLFGGGV